MNPTADTADYRRQARRIRASFCRDPLLRHRALGELAKRRNTETWAGKPVIVRRVVSHSEITAIDAVERGFAEYAATLLQPFGFSFSDRVRLLDAAERLGISRFHANMILALAEHHCPARRAAPVEVPSKTFAPPMMLILACEIVVVGIVVLLFNL